MRTVLTVVHREDARQGRQADDEHAAGKATRARSACPLGAVIDAPLHRGARSWADAKTGYLAGIGRCRSALDASQSGDGRGTKGRLKLTLPLSPAACPHRAAVQFNTVYQPPFTSGAPGLRWRGD